jgi:cytochrome c oxidase subunit 1
MFATGQAANDYYSLTSIVLLVPAGVEYFGMLGTILGGRLRFRPPMLFALAFIPQFLIGGLTGIMVGTPVIDYHVTDSYFIVAHLHYVLFAGSAFGLFAAIYFWFPKVSGVMLSERGGRLHFWLLVLGTNLTFLPMFALGYEGMPRRVWTYAAFDGFGLFNLLSSIGAAFLAAAMVVFIVNVLWTLRQREHGRAEPAPDDPWGAHTLEWATTSPPPRHNFTPEHPIPPITSFAPLLDLRRRRQKEAADSGSRS